VSAFSPGRQAADEFCLTVRASHLPLLLAVDSLVATLYGNTF
jgi:hypothetical protein